MGIFGSKFEMTDAQTKKLNSLLPESLRKESFTKNDISYNLQRVTERIQTLSELIEKSKKDFQEKKKKGFEKIAQKINIFNCELQDAKPLGMVDVGDIHKFSGSTTGDRFAGGLIGYALEMAIDDVWTKSSKQEESVNEVKLRLLTKALSLYPEFNVMFNYDVDFRELGSSGSVFIYMRGTASLGKNDLVDKAKKELENTLNQDLKAIEKLKEEKYFCEKNKPLLPINPNQIEEKLG